MERKRPKDWACGHGLESYFGSSVKGEAGIDWDDEKERRGLLGRIVADADRVLELGRRAQGRCPKESLERKRIVEAAELLGQLLLQDVERKEDGPALKEGVSKDRIPSVHDPPRCDTDARAVVPDSMATRPLWWWTPTPSLSLR